MNRSNELPMLEAALCYAARGWFVFPVPPGEKKSHKSAEHSGGRKWGKTSDPAEIERDWQRWPDANVGIATGPESGFFVVEADTKEGHEVDGIASLAELERQHGPDAEDADGREPVGIAPLLFQVADRRQRRHQLGIEDRARDRRPRRGRHGDRPAVYQEGRQLPMAQRVRHGRRPQVADRHGAGQDQRISARAPQGLQVDRDRRRHRPVRSPGPQRR